MAEWRRYLMNEEECDNVDRRKTMAEVTVAEETLVGLLWYQKATASVRSLTTLGDFEEANELQHSVASLCREIEEAHGGPERVRLDDDFELGMLMGKLSALRWVLGGGWDCFDC